MTQPQKQPDKENDGLTREFNFPKPWIRDYNPQIHGIKPGMGTQPPGAPPVSGQQSPLQPDPKSGQSPQYQPDAKTGQLPQYPASQPSQSTGQVQWNASGVYGGEAEKQKGIPTWTWTLISAAILIIVILILFFVILK